MRGSMSSEQSEKAAEAVSTDLGYGQHKRATYIVGTMVLLILGMVVGYFVLPEEWPAWRQIAGGGMMGLWSGFCVFMWRFLFFGDAENG